MKDCDVIVIGGGPAGSSAATFLAKKGWSVALFEKERFPRYHIGESLVPGLTPILEELGVMDAVEKAGFQKKFGISFIWGDEQKVWNIRWDENPSEIEKKYIFQVKRAEFDTILLDNARAFGVEVHEEAEVKGFITEGGIYKGVEVLEKEGTTNYKARCIIDASGGVSALIARRENKFVVDEQLKNIAAWTYFQGGKRYGGETAGNIIIENSTKGWLWYIPFSDGITSVGWCVNKKLIDGRDMHEQLLEQINGSKECRAMLENAIEVDTVRVTKDWSYYAEDFFGPGYVLMGDAAGFADPLFSTGCFLAMNAANMGAKQIDLALREPDKWDEYLGKYQSGYKEFLKTVIEFIHYFYDASLPKERYFEKASNLVESFTSMTQKQSFINLITGLAAKDVFERYSEPVKRKEIQIH